MPRQRTAREHSTALYQMLDHAGWIHSHITLEDFQEYFLLSLIENDTPDNHDPLETFLEFNATKAREASNGTYAREQDRNAAAPRHKRHEDMLEKWPINWWEIDPYAGAWEARWSRKSQ